MQCERAQEFFSDYLERTLDRPMTVALEAHLAGCYGCRDEVESLRDVFLTLEAVPAVEPPPDGAWQVLCRLHRAQAEEREAERQRAPGFLEWLRGLSPASAAMSAGLATLVIAGGILVTSVPTIRLKIIDIFPHESFAPAIPQSASTDAPAVLAAYGPLTGAGQQITIQVQPPTDLPDAHVQVAGGNMPMNWEGNGPISRGKPQDLLNVNVPVTSAPVAFRVLVESKTLGKQFRYLVVVPVGELKERPVTMAFPYQSLEESLRQLAPHLGKPVVVDAAMEGNVQLQAEERSPYTCLQDLATQLHAEVSQDRGVYHLAAPR